MQTLASCRPQQVADPSKSQTSASHRAIHVAEPQQVTKIYTLQSYTSHRAIASRRAIAGFSHRRAAERHSVADVTEPQPVAEL